LYDVFICHCSTDKDTIVVPLVAAFDQAGVKSWVDSKEIAWGDDIVARINSGLSQSRFVLVIISQHTNTRQWQTTEISTAMNAEISQGAVRVLPLYVGNRTALEQQIPMLANKHGMTWDNNPNDIAQALKNRLGSHSGSSAPSLIAKPRIPKLKVPLTDVDRDRFLRNAFAMICDFFQHAKLEAEATEPRITVDLHRIDTEKMRCQIYLNGKSIN